MLITICGKCFAICRLGDYRVIDTLQKKCCVTEYRFSVEFVTCVQCALSPQCGDGMEYKNETIFTCKEKFYWNSIRHQATSDCIPSLLKSSPFF